MNTGIESWNVDLMSIGPMYPFVGSEMWLALIGIATWLIWHFIQARAEAREIAEEEAAYISPGALSDAMDNDID